MARVKRVLIQRKKFFTGIFITFGITASIVALFAFVTHGFSRFDAKDYETNLYTEVFGVLFSVFVSVVIIGGWSYWRERQQLRARLKREAGSRSNDIAISAVEWLREKKWLHGGKGLLKGAELNHANLKNADLWFANLRGTSLIGANLQKAVLTGASLEDACLFAAELQEAQLSGGKLQRAICSRSILRGAGLSDANLHSAKLDGTDLLGADLREANLEDATFRSESDYAMDYYTEGYIVVHSPTILPDGTEYSHTVDLRKYTDPKHHEYTDTLRTINETRESMNIAPLEYFDFPPLNETFPYLFADDATSPT